MKKLSDELKKIAQPVKRELTDREKRTGKIGRNSPCYCGSGKKFKKCCMRRKGGL